MWRVRGRRRSRSRSACSCPTPEHRPRHLPARWRPPAPCVARAAAVGALPPYDAPVEHAARRRPLRARPPAGDRYELSRRRRRCRPCGCARGGRARRFTLDGAGPSESSTGSRRARLRIAGDLWSPGYFQRRAARRTATRRSIASTEPGTRCWRPSPATRSTRSRAARAPARRRAGPRGGRAVGARAGAGRRPVHHHSRRRASRTTPRARAAGDEVRTVIAGYHWFTDWGRDTMISLEGLTLTTGRHRGGRLHPPHLRPLRPRRPDPEHVPRGRERGPLPHRRRDALVLPRRRSLRARPPATARRCATSCRTLRRDRRLPRRGHALRHRRRPARRPAAPGRRGLPADLDGRQGGRLGRHAAARQGGGDQRALVQRASPARAAGSTRRATQVAGRELGARSAARCRSRSTSGSGTRRAATCTTWSTASTATTPRAGPNQLFAISLDHPVLDRGALAAGAGRRCASGC